MDDAPSHDPPWASPMTVDDPAEGHFYQSIELPGFGVQDGEWDLRGRVDDYLGHIDLAGRRVLEFGTANGFVCFEMERRGADVVAYDLGEHDDWDVVPYGGSVDPAVRDERHALARRLHAAWWLTHRLHHSSARVVHRTIYDVPATIGRVEVATFGSILLHLRDPFLALERGTALVDDTVVVTDMLPVFSRRSLPGLVQQLRRISPRLADRAMPDLAFVPDPATRLPVDTWWRLSPRLIGRYLAILGFPDQRVTYHTQTYRHPTPREIPMFTVVAHR